MAFLISNVKNRLVAIVVSLVVLASAMTIPAQPRLRKVRLGIFGYLVLPPDYKAYRTHDHRDAWYGYITLPDNKTLIHWTAGLVQTPFDNGDDKFVWIKRETVGKSSLKYGLLHTNDGDVLAAALPGLNLFMVLRRDDGLDIFLKLARSFKLERCNDCERPLPAAPSNNSLDRSGGCAFCIIIGPAKIEGIRAARSTQTFDGYLMTKAIRSILLLLMLSVPVAAQRHFDLESFTHPVRIPDALLPLLKLEIKSRCRGDAAFQSTNVRELFSALRINLNDRPSFILTSRHICLTGADNVWFWVFLQTRRGFRLVLWEGALGVDVLRNRTHGVRDLKVGHATAAAASTKIYKFNGAIYKPRACSFAELTGPHLKWHRTPCEL